MPHKPKKPCRHYGCPNLTDGMFCEGHKGDAMSDVTIRKPGERTERRHIPTTILTDDTPDPRGDLQSQTLRKP